MLVFYRSNECTNAIISSTKDKLAKDDKTIGLNVDFVNLDKRNYMKVLAQMEELPQFIYIWYDEKKVTEYINENYPTIEVLHFNVKNAIHKHCNTFYGYSAKEYKLADLITEKFKENLIKRIVYQVNSAYKISKCEMDDMDIASSPFRSFETKEEAKQYCIDCLEKDIKQNEHRIKDYEKNIKDCKSEIKKKQALLTKYTI